MSTGKDNLIKGQVNQIKFLSQVYFALLIMDAI